MKKTLSAKIDGREMTDSEIIDAILENREIENIESFLRPSTDNLIPFEELSGLDEAYNIITNTINNNGRFLVYFDQDCDGISAGTIMTRYLKAMDANVASYIGQGKAHGLQSLPLTEIQGIDTLIIVDSINDDVSLYEAILDLDVTIIVLDHHIIPRALIESNIDITLVSCMNDYPNPSLSGSAVTWKMVAYIDYMNLTDYADNLMDLAASGLVGDMMDLSVPENRYICYEGFNRLNNLALKKIIGSYAFNAESVSYSIAPLINACVRTNQNITAMKMFLSDDEYEVAEFISRAKYAKEEQKNMVDDLIGDLLEQGDSQLDKKCKVFFIPEEYRNLSGLLGNKLADVYQSPVLVVHPNNDNNLISGSMRAIGTKNFSAMINETGFAEAKGHENASGFECCEDVFDMFLATIETQLEDVEFETEVVADIELTPEQINENLIRQLSVLNRISGNGFPSITVMVRSNNYTVNTMSGGKHSKYVDSNTGLLMVSWNDTTWKDTPKNVCLTGIGTVSKVHYGKNNYLQLTMNDYDFDTTK